MAYPTDNFASIDLTGPSSDTDIVQLQAGKSIKVAHLVLVCSAACTLLIKSGSTTIAKFTFDANGGIVDNRGGGDQGRTAYVLQTAAGAALKVNASAGNVAGHIVYHLVDES